MQNFTPDRPIENPKDDRFQRFPFAKRVAQTIIERKTPDSIVIGLFGNWGEGKTSVLNFIGKELSKHDDVVVCRFNPWRFNDENNLLLGFFDLLALQLGKSVKTKAEKFGEVISDYADAVIPGFTFLEGVIGVNPGEVVKKAAENFSKVSIDVLKKRIEKQLVDAKKRVVVFVDDIDRLDRKEIQALFKLVKLTGDFAYTSYILAFDERMVAKALGEMYEDGGEGAGRNFLEKVIQVPLRLPLAQKEALKKYCFEQLDSVLNAANISLPEGDVRRFTGEFIPNILPQLNTPRMAVRYANALSFSVPLLKGEVNTVDLLLIEALKVFNPNVYEFIRDNPEFFIRGYDNSVATFRNENAERKQKAKEAIDGLLAPFEQRQRKQLHELMLELFPILHQVFGNIGYTEHSYKGWYSGKRIGSPDYFQRYFTYAVIEGDLSDVTFDEYVNDIKKGSKKENIKSTSTLLKDFKPSVFISKLSMIGEHLESEAAEKIARMLPVFGDKFFYDNNSFMGFNTSLWLASKFVFDMLDKKSDKTSKIEIAKDLVTTSTSFDFAYEIVFQIEAKWYQEEKIVNEHEFHEFLELLIEKVVKDSGDQPLFVSSPKNAAQLFSNIWLPSRGKAGIMEYVKPYLQKKPALIKELVRSFAPTVYGGDKPYPKDLEKKDYEWVNNTFDTDYLSRIALKVLSHEYVDKYVKLGAKQTDNNLLNQFVYLHKRAKNQA